VIPLFEFTPSYTIWEQGPPPFNFHIPWAILMLQGGFISNVDHPQPHREISTELLRESSAVREISDDPHTHWRTHTLAGGSQISHHLQDRTQACMDQS